MKFLLLLTLLVGSVAIATEQKSLGSNDDADENAFVAATSCSTILLGAEYGPGTTDEEHDLVESAQFHYYMVSQAIFKKLSLTDKWGNESYDSMYDAIVDAVQSQPVENIQSFGEACLSSYEKFLNELKVKTANDEKMI